MKKRIGNNDYLPIFRFVLPAIFGLFGSVIFAQERDTLYLWPKEVPYGTIKKVRPVQISDTTGGVVRITDIGNPSLTVFEPDAISRNKAAVIIAPGGAYKYLAINKEGYEIAEWLNDLGFTAFVLEYRAPDSRKGALCDMLRAIRLVRSLASKYHLNSNKIGVMGFSAGGHLALRASATSNEILYAKKDSIDQESARPDFSLLLYPAYASKAEDYSSYPEIIIDDKLPPIFMFGTFDDFLVKGYLKLAQDAHNGNAHMDMHLAPKGGHGYGMRRGNPAAEQWPRLAEPWLMNILKN